MIAFAVNGVTLTTEAMTAFRLLKTATTWSAVLLLVLLSICLFRAIVLFPTPAELDKCASAGDHVRIDESTRPGLVSRFSQALRIQTVTRAPHVYDAAQLIELRSFLRKCKSSPGSFVSSCQELLIKSADMNVCLPASLASPTAGPAS